MFAGMYTTAEIIKILSQKKPDLLGRYPISELGIFGSYARGDFDESSDIDILVDFNGRIGIGFIDLAHELEDLFNHKIDLVSRRAIKARYLPYVEKSLIHV
jgi:predicted nucleotidyltransferase